jgi:hypothetical protein
MIATCVPSGESAASEMFFALGSEFRTAAARALEAASCAWAGGGAMAVKASVMSAAADTLAMARNFDLWVCMAGSIA